MPAHGNQPWRMRLDLILPSNAYGIAEVIIPHDQRIRIDPIHLICAAVQLRQNLGI